MEFPNLVPRVLRLLGQRFGRQERLWDFFPQKSGVPVMRMLSFIKTEVNVSREVGMPFSSPEPTIRGAVQKDCGSISKTSLIFLTTISRLNCPPLPDSVPVELQ